MECDSLGVCGVISGPPVVIDIVSFPHQSVFSTCRQDMVITGIYECTGEINPGGLIQFIYSKS